MGDVANGADHGLQEGLPLAAEDSTSGLRGRKSKHRITQPGSRIGAGDHAMAEIEFEDLTAAELRFLERFVGKSTRAAAGGLWTRCVKKRGCPRPSSRNAVRHLGQTLVGFVEWKIRGNDCLQRPNNGAPVR